MTTQEKNNEQLRYSYADYLTWPEDIMQEIIDGNIYLYPAPLRVHAATISALLFKIGSFIRKRKCNCQVYTLPIKNIFFAENFTQMKIEYNNLYVHFVFTTFNRIPKVCQQLLPTVKNDLLMKINCVQDCFNGNNLVQPSLYQKVKLIKFVNTF